MAGNNLDVLELDAASHRGIDDIRSLRDAVKLAPAQANKKVYIIDEAHMLTLEAANALLKTLEEPPEHVIFILATTNPEKIIPTIRSRAVNLLFRKAGMEELTRCLSRVAKGEKIKVAPEVLAEMARAADGSFRDAVKLFEQLVREKVPLSLARVRQFLAQADRAETEELLALLAKRQVQPALLAVEKAIKEGIAAQDLVESLLVSLRQKLLAKVGIGEDRFPDWEKQDLFYLIELLIQVAGKIPLSPIEQLPLEIAVVKWGENQTREEKPEGGKAAEEGVKKTVAKIKFPQNGETQAAAVESKMPNLAEETWQTILTRVKPVNTSIEALLRAARPLGYDGKTLTLGVYYKFHKERLEEGTHRRVLEEIVEQVLNCPVKISCTLTAPPPKKEAVVSLTETPNEDIIKVAQEIFGHV
jgi:DNA polymerase-3 subunit gamma/tau